MTEALIVLPVIVLLVLTIVQWALIYHARSTLNYAALMAARYGAVNHASLAAMHAGLAHGLLPLYRPQQDLASAQAMIEGPVATDVRDFARVCVTSPGEAAFDAWEVVATDARLPGIPNLWQPYGGPNTAGGIDLRDANLLSIEVRYGYPMIVPWVSDIFAVVLDNWVEGYDEEELAWLAARRMPIKASATVRMQSEAQRVKVAEAFCA